MNIEQDMTCNFCNKIYQEPVIMNCCGNHICQEEINSIITCIDTSKKAACPFCNTVLENKTFTINRLLKSLIEKRELHNLKLDPQFEITLKNLKDKMSYMQMVENNPDSIIYESFSELKRQVDLDREQLKQNIDKQADEIIKILDSLEIEFKRESKTRVKEVFDDDFKKSLNNQFEEYEKTLNSIAKTNEERENKRLDIEETLKILELKQTQFKTKLFSNKSIKYEPFSKNTADLFGKLDVSDANWQAIECDVLIATINKRNSKINTIITPVMIQNLMFGTEKQQLEVMKVFREHLFNEPDMFVDIFCGIVPKFVEFLKGVDINLQFEAAWSLSSITAVNSLQTKYVVDAGALPILINLISSPSEKFQLLSVWCLGNIAVDGPECRDLLLDHGILSPLLQVLSKQTSLSLKKKAVRCISNLCHGKNPPVEFSKVETALPILALLLNNEEQDIIVDACRALSYLSENPNVKIQKAIESNVCSHLVELLNHSSSKVVQVAMRAVRKIINGDDAQTQIIIDCNGLKYLLKLLHSPKKLIKKEACWIISNIAARNRHQLQALIDAKILPKLIEIIAMDGKSTRKDAAWAVVNFTSGGTLDQIRCLVELNAIPPLCDLLTLVDSEQVKLVQEVLNSLYVLLLLALQNTDRQYAFAIIKCGGLAKIGSLKFHQNVNISQKAALIVETFFYQGQYKEKNISIWTDSINSNMPEILNPIDPGLASISSSSTN